VGVGVGITMYGGDYDEGGGGVNYFVFDRGGGVVERGGSTTLQYL